MHTCCTAIQISFASLESKVANLRNFGIQICVFPQDSNPACGWKDSTCIDNAFNTSDKRKKVLVCPEDLRCNMCASPSASAGTNGGWEMGLHNSQLALLARGDLVRRRRLRVIAASHGYDLRIDQRARAHALQPVHDDALAGIQAIRDHAQAIDEHAERHLAISGLVVIADQHHVFLVL